MQLRSYRDDFAAFEQAGAVVLAISPQDVDSHARWIDQEGFAFPLLADPEGQVIEQQRPLSRPGAGAMRRKDDRREHLNPVGDQLAVV